MPSEQRTLTNLQTGEVHILPPGQTKIGSNPSCDIVLRGKPEVQNRPSGVHAMIVGVALTDLASDYGTWTHVHNRVNPKLPSNWFSMVRNTTKSLERGEEICFGGHHPGSRDIMLKTPNTYDDRYPTDCWEVFRFDISDHHSKDLCPICINNIKDPAFMECGHRFCSTCLSAWLFAKNEGSCPMCRKSA
jgi:hypothetical protein